MGHRFDENGVTSLSCRGTYTSFVTNLFQTQICLNLISHPITKITSIF